VAMRGADDRKLDALYAGLTPTERTRLLARLWRSHDRRELDRLRATIPNAAAAAAYTRTVRTLRTVHTSMPATLLALKNGIERDTWLLFFFYDLEADRRRTRLGLHRLWGLLRYPVTESEYGALVAMERTEPTPLAVYADVLADYDGSEPGLHPDVAALLRRLPDELRREIDDEHGMPQAPGSGEEALQEEIRRARAVAGRLSAVIAAAIARGDLPEPQPTTEGPSLPWGTLKDWGEGTTAETYEPFGPGYHVPALGLLGGDVALWDRRPDGDAEAVTARRGALLEVMADLGGPAGTVDDEPTTLTLEPPATLEERERERAREQVERLWPRGAPVRDDVRALAAAHAGLRAQLGAYAEAIARFQREEFGGEDPLDPMVRTLLDLAWSRERRYEEIWNGVTDLLAPIIDDGGEAWPPPLDNEVLCRELGAETEEHLRGEWNA
jgi:hypothetical protein